MHLLGERWANLQVQRLPRDAGYGGARKAAFEYALLKSFDHVVMMRGDGLHPPANLPALIAPIHQDPEQMVFAYRHLRLPKAPGGWKLIPNLVAHTLATGFQNRLLGLRLRDYHSGYRLYAMRAIERIPYQLDSDDHRFDMQLVIQCRRRRSGGSIRRIGSASPRYFGRVAAPSTTAFTNFICCALANTSSIKASVIP